MNRLFKSISLFVSINIVLSSCIKEAVSNQFDPFYNFNLNGTEKRINACGTSDFVAAYLKDTAVYASFSCGQGAGFYLKGKILDGTYLLNDKNKAFYYDENNFYTTDILNVGTLTIKSGNWGVNGGSIPFVEGTFSFDAINKNTGQKVKITSGKYLLKKYQY